MLRFVNGSPESCPHIVCWLFKSFSPGYAPEHAFTLGSDRIQPKTPPANARGRIYPKWSLSLTKDVESSRCDLIGVAGCGGNRAGKFALLGAAAPTKPVHIKVNDWRGE